LAGEGDEEMSEMVERVARVLCADENWREIVAPDKLPAYVDAHWRSCIPAARAAIEAMRDLPAPMVRAGAAVLSGSNVAGRTRRVWSAVIDAALAEGSPEAARR
jgi:hypothetical protein